jgi:hypothetical protein
MTAVLSDVEAGEWLIDNLAEAERREATWLHVLAQFDIDQGWAVDGQLSGAEWLMWKARMARATAYEKLQVAHQLRRRPLLAEAFGSGSISYSAARVLSRIDPEADTERALIDLAMAGSVRDLERIVGYYQRLEEQGRAPSEALRRRGVRVKPGLDGTTTIELRLSDVEVEEFLTVLSAFIDLDDLPVDESARADGAVDESARADRSPDESARADWEEAPLETQSWAARLADAAMTLARTGLAHANQGAAAGDDRYMIHVVQRGDQMTLGDGTPLDRATAERLACDASAVAHLLGPEWEPLALGRKTKQWNTAQRRAIKVRDGGICRWPGCWRRVTDIHHHHHWERGGSTDVSNGYLCCSRHHSMIHADGYYVTGKPNRVLNFYRPDGTILGYSEPRAQTLVGR